MESAADLLRRRSGNFWFRVSRSRKRRLEIAISIVDACKHIPNNELIAALLMVQAAADRRELREVTGKRGDRTSTRRYIVAEFVRLWLAAGHSPQGMCYINGEAVITLRDGLWRRTGVSYSSETVKGYIRDALTERDIPKA